MHSLVIWGEYETREGTVAKGNAERGQLETIETIRAHESCDQMRVLIKREEGENQCSFELAKNPNMRFKEYRIRSTTASEVLHKLASCR